MGGVSIQLPWVVKTTVYAGAKPHCHLTKCMLSKEMHETEKWVFLLFKWWCRQLTGSPCRGTHMRQLLLEPWQRRPKLCRTVVQIQISPTTTHIHETYIFPQKFIKKKTPSFSFSWQKKSLLKGSYFSY